MTTMIGPLRRAVQVAPERIAARCGETELTYEQTWDRARRLIGALRDLGVGNGDRVAVCACNCHRYLELHQAVPGAGMVLVPLNQRHTAAELGYGLEDSGAKVLFAGAGIEYHAGVVPHAIDLDDGYEALIAGAPAADLPNDLDSDAVAGLFYTGGTTGAAKGVMLTHRNLVANAFHFQASFAFGPETRWLVAAPLFHAAGSIAVLATVWHAGRQVLLPVFDPGAALDLIEAEGVNATLLVPTMLAALVDEQLARPRDVSTLRLVSHGGAPIASETLRRAHAAFPDAELMHLYGTTETAPIATVHAVVVPRADVDEAELLQHCRALIAGYKVPKRIELRNEPLPKSGAGKLLKRELRAPHWAGHESMVAGA